MEEALSWITGLCDGGSPEPTESEQGHQEGIEQDWVVVLEASPDGTAAPQEPETLGVRDISRQRVKRRPKYFDSKVPEELLLAEEDQAPMSLSPARGISYAAALSKPGATGALAPVKPNSATPMPHPRQAKLKGNTT